MESISAKIIKVLFRSEKNYYSVLLARVNDKTETLVGFFPIVNKGLEIHCHAKREKGRTQQWQYNVDSYSLDLPTKPFDMHLFLTNDFIRLKEVVANLIINKIGISYLQHYANMGFIETKVGEAAFKKYKNEFFTTKKSLDEIHNKLRVMDTLNNIGFRSDISSKVAFSEYKTNPESIETNPYQLIFPFELEWKTIDSIAMKNGIKPNSLLRRKEGITYLLDEAVKKSAHIYLPRKDLHNQLNSLLKISTSDGEFKIAEEELENEERIRCDIESHIYGHRYYVAEQGLSKNLYRINSHPKLDDETVSTLMDKVIAKDFPFSPEQLLAIEGALKNRLLIIRGAAGVGKTTALLEIVEAYEKLKYNIILCAPTGKAADRMKEVTGKEAKTAHSILNHDTLTKQPAFNQQNPLDADIMIIDEASMIDTVLFYEILDAIKEGATVVIVGDVDQLPSIGPGRVLYELIHVSPFPKVELTKVHRQGEDSAIYELSDKIRHVDNDIGEILQRKSTDLFFTESNNIHNIAQILINTVTALFNNPKIDFYRDIQIITPMHKTEIGTVRLNERIQTLLNEDKPRKKIIFANKTFYIGDKVIHTKNDINRNVFNGETGKITNIISKKVSVKFTNGKTLTYSGEELFDLELAFATTVHKMQGSETSIIIMPIHSAFHSMMTRNLIYTGFSRAKRRLLIIGQQNVLEQAILRDDSENRNCNLARRLKESKFHLLITGKGKSNNT